MGNFTLTPTDAVVLHDDQEYNIDGISGCYYCKKLYPSNLVKDFVDEIKGGHTPICPLCSIDSVISIDVALKLHPEAGANQIIDEMHRIWFDTRPNVEAICKAVVESEEDISLMNIIEMPYKSVAIIIHDDTTVDIVAPNYMDAQGEIINKDAEAPVNVSMATVLMWALSKPELMDALKDQMMEEINAEELLDESIEDPCIGCELKHTMRCDYDDAGHCSGSEEE